jgi:hypothetical protein
MVEVGQRIIVDGRQVYPGHKHAWRRGVILSLSDTFPRVRLERRARERKHPETTFPGFWLLPDTPEVRETLGAADLLEGRDDA